jgi:hypothetical protein
MLHRSRLICLFVALGILPAVSALGQDAAAKAYLGTWKLNLAKSKFDPGPGPKELTRIHEDAGGGQIRVTTKTVGQDGTPGSTTYTYRPDGKDVPVTGGRGAGPATIAITAVDPYSVTFIQKNAGKEIGTGRRVVSKDGKTMTITTTGTNVKGQKTSSTQVFEKG